jgi:hypothetical protein
MAIAKLKTVKAVYDFAKQGGAISVITLPVNVPTGAFISRVFIKPTTPATSGGSATVALDLGGVALKAATAYNNAAFTASNIIYSTGAVTTTAANLTWTIAGATVTAGKYEIVVEYFG